MQRLVLRYVKLLENATPPSFAHGPVEDAGMDLFAAEEVVVPERQWRTVRTGLAIEIPPGYDGQVRPRSGLATRHGRLRLPGDSSINTGMECGGNVKARATTRFLWWTLHLTRDAAEAALLPSRSRKPGTGYGRRLAISRLAQGTEGKVCQSAARSYRSSTQPRQRAAEPRGSVSAFRPARRSAAGLCRTSTRSFRRGPSRGRRRKPEFVGDDGGGGA